MRILPILAATLSTALGLAGCSSTQLGGGGSVVQGSAGEVGNAEGANASLERCNQPLGTVTLDESNVPSQNYHAWWGNNVNSTIPMFRLLAAQSGCFALVERGQAFELLERERQLSKSGQLQSGSNIGDGQLAAADYVLRPEIIVSDPDAGGIGGTLGGISSAVGGALGSTLGGVIGSVGANVNYSDAQTLIYIIDVRSGLQKGIAEGSARTTDFGGRLGLLTGLPGWGSVRGYTSTAQGKVVTASYLDAFNGLVRQLRTSG